MSAALEARRPVGRSAVTIPRIALGCATSAGRLGARVLRARADRGPGTRADDAAWEFGIRRFDTADAYGGGRSERAIGRWIQSRGVCPRLTTKIFNLMQA
jgi:aryl-alcohol dehydrogenase-like predicted oxidoreductase